MAERDRRMTVFTESKIGNKNILGVNIYHFLKLHYRHLYNGGIESLNIV